MPRPLSPGRLLLRTLQESATPLYALDSQRRIVFASQSLGEWIGVEADKLIGLKCDYHSGGNGPLTAAAAALCPPPEALSGSLDAGIIVRTGQDGQPAARRPARFFLLSGKPGTDESLLLVMVQSAAGAALDTDAAAAPQRLHALLAQLRGQLGKRLHIGQLIGQSRVIQQVREQVRIAAESRARVLLVGPPGSGREHVARTIHYAQPGKPPGPLSPIDCQLVDAEQLQRALAGILRRHVESPSEQPPAALLLEVDRLREGAQHELAAFLELPNLELRTLATARRPLSRLVAKGRFRSDLALALSTLTIRLPPLARRREDIPLLAQHFLEEANADGGVQHSGFQPAALELLAGLPWAGNLDQLAAAVRAACDRSAMPRIAPSDFPDWVQSAERAAALPPRDEEAIHLDEFLEGIEKEILERALRKARGNKTRAAELLGVNRNRLLRRLVQLGLMAPPPAEEPVVFEPLPEET